MTNFGYHPGILDYWMLLTDWRNGSLAILLSLGVLLVGYALATRHKILASEGPSPVAGTDDAGAKREETRSDGTHTHPS